MLREDAALVDRVLADVGPDLVRRTLPAAGELPVPVEIGEAGAPVGGDPAHDLR